MRKPKVQRKIKKKLQQYYGIYFLTNKSIQFKKLQNNNKELAIKGAPKNAVFVIIIKIVFLRYHGKKNIKMEIDYDNAIYMYLITCNINNNSIYDILDAGVSSILLSFHLENTLKKF